MKLRWNRGQAIVALLCVVLMLGVAACGGGDDDNENTTTPATATATTGSSQTEPTATTGDEADATATNPSSGAGTATESAPSATATVRSDSEATATDSPASTPTTPSATATSSVGNDSTATPTTTTGSASPTTALDLELPDIETLDPELLPNFSMRMSFQATNFTGTPETSMEIELQQSEIGSYHMRMETNGEGLEVWTIGDQSWTSVGGQIVESPMGGLFDPADMLTTGELIPDDLDARKDGKETVNGRQTTRWVIDGASYVENMNKETQEQGLTTIEMSDGEGEVVVWIDDELEIMIKADGDVTWKNSDSTNGSLIYQYEIFDIGSTSAITKPQ